VEELADIENPLGPVIPPIDPNDPDEQPQQEQEEGEPPIDPIEEPPIEPIMAALPPVFFRNPGLFINAGAPFVDWTSDREIKNWKAGTKALEVKFDLKQVNLMNFLNRVNERSTAFNWNGIINVPHGDPAVPTNLIEIYGRVTTEECRAHATT
jgi:hypothetical protein